MGAKMPLPADQLEEFQNRKGIIEELYLADSGAELSIEGVFPVNGSDAYKMAIKKGDQVSYKYFDKESGLLVREEKSQKGPDGKDTLVPTDFHDYKDINGLKIAHKVTTQAMGQSMEMEIKDLQINPVFDAGTFK
jgi:hypothetical protein